MSLSAADSARIATDIIRAALRQVDDAMESAGHSDRKIFWSASKELQSALKILSHIPTKIGHDNEMQKTVERMRVNQALLEK